MASTRDVILQADRFDEAIIFYRDVLGFEQTTDEAALAGFETGSFTLYVEPGSSSGPVFEIEFDDPDDAKELLTAHGCEIIDENPSLPRCYVRDPYGLVFNIAQR